MSLKLLRLAVLLLGPLAWPIAASAAEGPIPVNCDGTCLEHLVDEFQKAVVAHDPQMLPLAKDVRYTEMGQQLELGDGFWGTASGIGSYKHYYPDPEDGQVAFMGTMLENGNPVLMALRLRVQLGRITQIETVFYRKGNGPKWNDEGIDKLNDEKAPPAEWQQPIPVAQRASRQQLIATANMYFAGLQRNNGKGVYPFSDDCNRIENGVATTNNNDLKMGTPDFNPAAMGCKKQFETGFYGVVTRIYDRRFMIADPELGVVVAFATFCHNGTVHQITTPEGKVVPMPFFNRPSSIQIVEAFRIEGGLIHKIEAVGASVPYGMKSGWAGGISGE